MSHPRLPALFFLLIFLIASTSFLSQICSAADEDEELDVVVYPSLRFENLRIREAYIALQAWKSSIFSNPFNFTANWNGFDVCSYMGIYCAPSPSNPKIRVVAGIDLNHADIAG